jgi:hypothetical protein
MEQAPAQWDRRGVLRLGAGLAAGAGLVALSGDAQPHPDSIYKPELNELMAAAEPYLHYEHVPRPMPTHEQVAVADNPRLTRKIGGTANHATVIVHPGYFTQTLRDAYAESSMITSKDQLLVWEYSTQENSMQYDRDYLEKLTERLQGSQGDYNAYRSRLVRTYANAAAQPHVPLVVYTESRRLYGGTQHKGLETPRHALQIASIDNSPTPEETVRYQGDYGIEAAPQNEQLMYDWLRKNGIDTIRLAGEYGIQPDLGYIIPACAGTVALNFLKQGFNVHGIEGAIFPSKPMGWSGKNPGATSTKDNVRAAKAMYSDTVAI